MLRTRYIMLSIQCVQNNEGNPVKKTTCALLISACLSTSLTLSAFAINTAQPAPAPQPTSFTPAQTKQIEGIIKQYLVSNPEVLVEASQTLQEQQAAAAEKTAISAIKENKAGLFNNPDSPTFGSRSAPITLVEFFDYQCGHCRAMGPILEKFMKGNTHVRMIFKELPIFGGQSKYAAKAALAANMQPQKYYAFHNALLAAQEPLTEETVMALARSVGIDTKKLKYDMKSPQIDHQLRDNFALAQALKLAGTPTFVISNAAQTKFRYIPGATSVETLATDIKAVQ